MSGEIPTGFLLVDKPSGSTSHDVVARLRRLTGVRKMGHAGTLDPMATGLLVVGVRRATRLLRFVQGGVKEYLATACFGVATDTLDAEGSVLSRSPLPVGSDEVAGAMTRFVGDIRQIPPMVSAVKVEGRRLYELARNGTEIERQARTVTVHELELVDLAPSDYPEVTFRVRCSGGTYVRTLADDLAAAFGGHAHLTALRRTRNGMLSVGDAHDLETLTELAGDGRIGEAVVPPAEGLPDLPAVAVDPDTVVAVRNGMSFPHTSLRGESPATGPMRVLSPDGELLAVYRRSGAAARPEVVLG